MNIRHAGVTTPDAIVVVANELVTFYNSDDSNKPWIKDEDGARYAGLTAATNTEAREGEANNLAITPENLSDVFSYKGIPIRETLTMANSISGDGEGGGTVKEITITAGKVGLLLSVEFIASLSSLVDVPAAVVSLGSNPSMGNYRVDAVVYDTGDSTVKIIDGDEFPETDTYAMPVVDISQRVIALYVLTSDGTVLPGPETQYSLKGLTDLKVQRSVNTFGTFPRNVSSYQLSSTADAIWLQRNEGLNDNGFGGHLILSEISGEAYSQMEYVFTLSNILNGALYRNFYAIQGAVSLTGNISINGTGQKTYRYTINADTFTGADPLTNIHSVLGAITIPADETLLFTRLTLTTPFLITGGDTATVTLTNPDNSAGLVSADLLAGQGLDALGAGYKGIVKYATEIGGTYFVLSNTGPTSLDFGINLNTGTFALVTQYGEAEILVITQKAY